MSIYLLDEDEETDEDEDSYKSLNQSILNGTDNLHFLR